MIDSFHIYVFLYESQVEEDWESHSCFLGRSELVNTFNGYKYF